jgi:hypothetical protein
MEEISVVDFKETHQIKSSSTEASTSVPEVKSENLEIEIPEVKLYDLKGSNFQNTPFSSTGVYDFEIKEESLVPNIVYTRPILSLPKVRVSIPANPEDYLLYLGSSHIISPIYSSGRSEGPSTSSQISF